jgi:hypothetical protein
MGKIGDIKDKIAKRNKLIKIADTSEGGWETVRQYQTNPIASDTDDETRILLRQCCIDPQLKHPP